MNNFIQTHRWTPPEGVAQRKGSVYLLHGTGEHAARYQEFALSLANDGWLVGAHDHPGHGSSRGKRGLIDPPGSLATQAAIQIQTFARETNTTPVVFGHSLGGVLAMELALIHKLPTRGLILSAPAFVPITRWTDQVKLKLLTLLAPRLCLDLGYNASRLTHDEKIRKIAESDSLIHGYKSATLINWLFESGARSMAAAGQLNVPLLLLIAGDDHVVESDSIRAFSKQVPTKLVTVQEYDGLYHELLNETPEQRSLITNHVHQWLNKLD